MKRVLLLLLFVSGLAYGQSNSSDIKGYLFIDLAKMKYLDEELTLLGSDQERFALFSKGNVGINGTEYSIIEEEHLYEDFFKVEHYDPEYNVFVVSCEGIENGYYLASINNEVGYVNIEDHKRFVRFKSVEQYFLDGHYYLNRTENILRSHPNSDSLEITVKEYKKYFFKATEMRGDWLKLQDDKECPLGEMGMSELDIKGWLQWRRNGKIIVDFALKCW